MKDATQFHIRPARPDEAGLFYTPHPEEDKRLGTVAHVRMDFGRSGNEFWHTWWPRGPEELNSPAFKEELQQVVDTLREDVLKNRFAMERFCYEHGGKIDGGWVQNYGYVVETEHYRYCLRCNPSPGDYNAYLTCFDLDVQRQNMARDTPLVGRVTYLEGASLKAIAEELTGRQIPYTQRTTTWDKARIARIIDNAKYIGTEEYDPIIDEDMYEAAVSLKTARQRNTCEKENDVIDLLRDFVRCDNCGQPMKRRVSMKHRIRESWNCTNDDCGIRVRISDTQLIETITVLINRVILNDHLLQPKPKKRYEPDAKVTKAGNDIDLELEREAPNEEYIIEKTIEMASLMYEQSNAKLNLTVSLARKAAHMMVTQDEFNRDYFTALASYIALGEQGKVVLHTKTETEVTLDDGSNESS